MQIPSLGDWARHPGDPRRHVSALDEPDPSPAVRGAAGGAFLLLSLFLPSNFQHKHDRAAAASRRPHCQDYGNKTLKLLYSHYDFTSLFYTLTLLLLLSSLFLL